MNQNAPRVLIADDEPHIRAVIRCIVTSLGAEVVYEAGDGEQAVQGFLDTYPDVAILDINMPKMTGDIVLAEMLARKPSMVAVMMSAQDTINTVRDCLEIGAFDYLLKSNSAEEIRRLLNITLTQPFAELRLKAAA